MTIASSPASIPRLAEVSPGRAAQTLCEVVQRALAPDREDRYRSRAVAMKDALVAAFPPRSRAARAAVATHVKASFAKGASSASIGRRQQGKAGQRRRGRRGASRR